LHFSQNTLPEELFSIMAQQAWSMWLDSCDSEHVDSQYNIMVWQPELTLVTEGDITTIKNLNTGQCQQSNADPLELLSQEQNHLFSNYKIPKNSVPFIGGALGYFSYDLGRRFECLPALAIKDIELPEMAIGLYTKAIVFDNKSQQYFLVCEESQRHDLEQALKTELADKHSNQTKQKFNLTVPWQANISKTQYQEKFNTVQAHLLSGDCYQINLTQRFSSQYQGDEYSAYKALRRENNAPFSAFLQFEQHTILSISPERFLQLHNKHVQSKPIKGTKARSDDPIIDQKNTIALKTSEKDRAENLMIVDLLRNDISKVCLPGSVKVPSLFDIESFPAVHHLVSTVVGELADNFKATDLIRGAFPGGSITGAPKISAMKIIEQLEPHRRSIYCGSIGYISACGNMDTSITIRTLVCEKTSNTGGDIYCWAGGGIVADSEVDAEYQESFDKVNKILPILEQL